MTDSSVALENPYKDGEPYGWIQWKGTTVCADLYCKCGEGFHIDAAFAYMVQCPDCKTVYAVNGFIKLHEIDEYDIEDVITDEYKELEWEE